MAEENNRQEAFRRVASLIDNGFSTSYIHDKLLEEGFSEEDIKSILANFKTKAMQNANHNRRLIYQNRKETNMGDKVGQLVIGLTIIAIACGLTFFSMTAASNSSGGGTFIVATGALAVGVRFLLRGLMA
jgi:hypothetical protein